MAGPTEKRILVGQYRCPYCGYVYHPDIADPAHGAPPGTAFHDVPNDWRCPECDTEHSAFAVWSAPAMA